MFEKKFKSLGIKDMHPMQVEALMGFIGDALHLAAMTDQADILEDVEESADDLVKLFGGQGIMVKVDNY